MCDNMADTTNILDKATSATGMSFGELLAAGAMKHIEERFTAPLIGNGTFKSGLIKLGAAYLFEMSKVKFPLSESLKAALAIDGAEDVTLNLLQMFGLGGGPAASPAQDSSMANIVGTSTKVGPDASFDLI
jgi:hypothetical protein